MAAPWPSPLAPAPVLSLGQASPVALQTAVSSPSWYAELNIHISLISFLPPQFLVNTSTCGCSDHPRANALPSHRTSKHASQSSQGCIIQLHYPYCTKHPVVRDSLFCSYQLQCTAQHESRSGSWLAPSAAFRTQPPGTQLNSSSMCQQRFPTGAWHSHIPHPCLSWVTHSVFYYLPKAQK